jgi:aspartate-semialdehyde dehydrogenase
LEKDVTRDQFLQSLKSQKGLVVHESLKGSDYPMQLNVSGKDPVYVGRIHQDPENPKLWLMWVVSDNIRKGAALNGIQIAEQIFGIQS